MFKHLGKAFAQLGDPKMNRVVFASLGAALILMMLLIGGAIALIENTAVFEAWYLRWANALPKHYPDFNALIYSIDVFIPIVDLGQESYWLPRYSKEHGWIYVFCMWFHIAFGWILTTLGVVGMTGIVKKE